MRHETFLTRMERAIKIGEEIDRTVREIAKTTGENYRTAYMSPLETVQLGRIRHAYEHLTPLQRAILDSADADGKVISLRNIPHKVYTSLVRRRLLAPDGHGNYLVQYRWPF